MWGLLSGTTNSGKMFLQGNLYVLKGTDAACQIVSIDLKKLHQVVVTWGGWDDQKNKNKRKALAHFNIQGNNPVLSLMTIKLSFRVAETLTI